MVSSARDSRYSSEASLTLAHTAVLSTNIILHEQNDPYLTEAEAGSRLL